MRKFVQRFGKALLSVLLGVMVGWFFSHYYPGHLYFQEQFQLFLFDADYGWERVSVPGGVAAYLAEYLTQFYYNAWMGGLIIALLLVAVQRIVWSLAKYRGATDTWYLLSFLPAIGLWGFLCDENGMLAWVVSLLLALCTICIYTTCKGFWNKIVYVLIVTPLLYWMAGAVHFLFLGWLVMYEWIALTKAREWVKATSVTVGAGLLGIACPLLASWFVQYPLFRLMGGIDYYRFPAVIPLTGIVLIVVLIVEPFVLAALPALKKKVPLWMSLQFAVLWVVGGECLSLACDWEKEELMMYDYHIKNGQWAEVITQAEKKMPASPFSVTCLNLALGKTGQLGDRMFQFYQNGPEGLLPDFQRDFISPLPTAEVYYQLGMINTAQRFTFEAMEAIPNYRKSARCFKRLAETNIINGHYEVAAKYLHALCKTLFYRVWAEDALTYLYQEEKINSHPEWGRLRKLRYSEDFLFSNREMNKMLELLLLHHPDNRLAFEYLLAYTLQTKDLKHFMDYYPLGKDMGYNHIPRSYQEALIYVWTQNHHTLQDLPWSISPQVVQEVQEFAQIYTTRPDAQRVLGERYGNTYWYYLLFRK